MKKLGRFAGSKASEKTEKLHFSNKSKKRVRSGLVFAGIFAVLGGIYLLSRSDAAPTPGLPTPTISVAQAGGAWSNPSTWTPARVPSAADVVDITKNVVIDTNTTVAGIHINSGSELTFDPTKSITLNSSGNIIARGTLQMRPQNTSVSHAIRFVEFNEADFVGGCLYTNYPIAGCSGMTPVASDVGLWVTGDGKLNANGSNKTSWSRLAGAANAGATTITLEATPTGWSVGDEISVAPSEPPNVNNHYTHFDLRTIQSINGATITLNSPLQYNHPQVTNPGPDGGSFRAEVLNLTRNVRIEGQDVDHQSHIFISSTQGQAISNMAIRFMGPHHAANSPSRANQFVLGRYGLHFHMNSRMTHTDVNDGTRRPTRVVDAEYNWPGAIVDGVVVRDTDSHAFVAHESDNVTFKNTISYRTSEEAYWWDAREFNNPLAAAQGNTSNAWKIPAPTISNNITYDHAVAALVTPSIGDSKNYRVAGFYLGAGENMRVKNSVAVGISDGVQTSGFTWPENDHGVWIFEQANITHNNAVDGIFGWQNDNLPHSIGNVAIYHNGDAGVMHGAYQNTNQYFNLTLIGNRDAGFEMHASALRSRPISLINSIIDGAGLPNTTGITFEKHSLPPAVATRVANTSISGTTNKIEVRSTGDTDGIEWFDFEGVNVTPADFRLVRANPIGANVRVQPTTGTPFQFTDGAFSSSQTIAPFATLSSAPKGAKGPWTIPAVSPQSLSVPGVTPSPTPTPPTPTPPSPTPTPTPPTPAPTPPSPTPTPTPPSPTPTPTPKNGDVTGDGIINLTDFFIVRSNFGKTGMTRAQGDLNGDGTINLTDFFILRQNFGN